MSWREAAYIDLEFLWQMETGFPPIDQGGSDLFVGITECLVATAAVPTDEGAVAAACGDEAPAHGTGGASTSGAGARRARQSPHPRRWPDCRRRGF